MNIANLDKLIAALEAAPDEKFNMESYFSSTSGKALSTASQSSCRSAACIAGWCMWAAGVKGKEDSAFVFSDGWLELEANQSMSLFQPPGFWDRDRYTRSHAIATLKRLRDTGEVRWCD